MLLLIAPSKLLMLCSIRLRTQKYLKSMSSVAFHDTVKQPEIDTGMVK